MNRPPDAPAAAAQTPSARADQPLGVFDSGVGGLSVLAELRALLPGEHLLYLADTAHVPYGVRSDEDIRDLTARAVAALHQRGAKGVVVACNTASAFSLSHLRTQYGPSFPVIGLVPALKPAVEATRSGVVGVLATPGTLRGTLLTDVIERFAVPAGVNVMTAVSTALVPLVERGEQGSAQARAELRRVLTPLAEAGADLLVLGCTHYPYLTAAIQAEFGATFTLLDSGAAVARQTRRVLGEAGLLRSAPAGLAGEVRYLVTGDPDAARPIISSLVRLGLVSRTSAAGATGGHTEQMGRGQTPAVPLSVAPDPDLHQRPPSFSAPLPVHADVRIESIQT